MLDVSIIIPTYNRANFIGESLISILKQTHENWECLIVDDGSNDRTKEIVLKYVEFDKRFVYLSRPEDTIKGANSCRNYGFQKSKGKLIIFLDSDDLLIETCLEDRYKCYLEEQADIIISHSLAFNKKIGDNNILWNTINTDQNNKDLIVRFLNVDMPWCTHGIAWSRNFFQKYLSWDETLSSWQDWDLHVRALMLNPKISTIHKIDNYFRLGGHDKIGKGFNTISYYKSIKNIIKKTSNELKTHNLNDDKFILDAFKKFVIRVGVLVPIKRNNIKHPLLLIFDAGLIIGVSKFYLIYVYIIQLINRHKIFGFIPLEKVSNAHCEKYKLKSTHMRLAGLNSK